MSLFFVPVHTFSAKLRSYGTNFVSVFILLHIMHYSGIVLCITIVYIPSVSSDGM